MASKHTAFRAVLCPEYLSRLRSERTVSEWSKQAQDRAPRRAYQ